MTRYKSNIYLLLLINFINSLFLIKIIAPLFIGSILLEVYIIITFLSNTFPSFLFANILLGIAVTFTSGCDSALLVDSLIADESEEEIGKYSIYKQFIFYSSLALSALVGGKIANDYSYSTVYMKIKLSVF